MVARDAARRTRSERELKSSGVENQASHAPSLIGVAERVSDMSVVHHGGGTAVVL